jgi:hypothetical protein
MKTKEEILLERIIYRRDRRKLLVSQGLSANEKIMKNNANRTNKDLRELFTLLTNRTTYFDELKSNVIK